jgi:starvation-inducible DNA-binding protein
MSALTVSKAASERASEAPDGNVCHQLQSALVVMVDLQLQAKQAHWNVVGRGFRSLHVHLDDLVDLAREAADTFAERMRALGSYPDARLAVLAASSTLLPAHEGAHHAEHAARAVSTRLRQASESLRHAHAAVEGLDSPTADLLSQVIVEVEKHAWMFEAETAPTRTTAL